MLPIAGDVMARVYEVTEVSIHGDRYFDMVVQREGETGGMRVRVAAHAAKWRTLPKLGAKVKMSVLMGQVVGVEEVGEGGVG